jgi:hypothetical protein
MQNAWAHLRSMAERVHCVGEMGVMGRAGGEEESGRRSVGGFSAAGWVIVAVACDYAGIL